MDEICGFRSFHLEFCFYGNSILSLDKRPIMMFCRGLETKWVFFLRFFLLKAWQCSQCPAGSVLTWPVHSWPQTLMWYGHISCVPLIERAPICLHVLWKYSASAYFPRTAEGWQFFDVALMYTGRQDSISLYIDIQDSILGPEILFSVAAGSVERPTSVAEIALEKYFYSAWAFRYLKCTYVQIVACLHV